ncbi:hypothetical protein niasHT_000362 [Heterodera trifolii]|uniref:Secreted protein n=1 Tax=Heterodera trifolii TaxID=157864 RepID=A0ABD2MC32_9BILA
MPSSPPALFALCFSLSFPIASLPTPFAHAFRSVFPPIRRWHRSVQWHRSLRHFPFSDPSVELLQCFLSCVVGLVQLKIGLLFVNGSQRLCSRSHGLRVFNP